MEYAVNCSILFQEFDLLERATRAKEAGFEFVEFWWPWKVAVPTDHEVNAFVDAVTCSGAQLVGLNLFAGLVPGPDRWVVSWAARQDEFRASVPIAMNIAEQTGCKLFNTLYGNRHGDNPIHEDEVALENLSFAAEAAQAIDGTLLLEPLSGTGAENYPLKTADECVAVLDKLQARGIDNVRLLADLYHLLANGDNVIASIQRHAGSIGHVQIADFPGRGQPGQGEAPLQDWLDELSRVGYVDYVALEYVPTVATLDSFDALPTLQTRTDL